MPESVVTSLSGKKRFPVSVTVAGHTYASTLVFYKGQFIVPLSAEHRSAAGVEAGQAVEVDIVLDDAVRTVAVPDDLATALADNGIRPAFDSLSYSNQRAHVLSVDGAKTEATRTRRIEKVVETMKAGS
ncbi:hypothetical protein GCM10007304_05870 [Rhodococcoides trifolii]|uniref:DUF1905 domain-containing protein n=1 Tax=Rhodococcoides trifolii TaxID=908250 RepID=A0A917CRQ7_9NOCA|nr:hypothetical protein GCM10007304_05870 [Rhodococcus trifolii]